VTVAFGADLGFVSDSSALVGATVLEPVEILVMEERRPKKGAPLKPSEVIGDFAQTIKLYGGSAFCADAHYREAAREHLEARGIEFVDAPAGQTGKAETYLHAKKVIHERRVRIPNVPRLLTQLRQIVSRPLPGGGVQITSPRRRGGGGHGDLVSAFVNALWSAREGGDEPAWLRAMTALRQREEDRGAGGTKGPIRVNPYVPRPSGGWRTEATGNPPLFSIAEWARWDSPDDQSTFSPAASEAFKLAVAKHRQQQPHEGDQR
jgi:hypothetical protein